MHSYRLVVGLVILSLARHPLPVSGKSEEAAVAAAGAISRQESYAHTDTVDVEAAEEQAAAAAADDAAATSNSECPQFCTCVRTNDDRLIAKCIKLTATQQFSDRLSDFKLFGDSGSAEDQAITLDDGIFRRLKMESVRSITICDVTIKSIHVNAFKGLHDLALVNFTNNNLERIHPDTFATIKNLRQLSLSGNPLSFNSQTPYILNVPYLQEIDLSSCQLDNLTASTFSKLSLLTYLNLASNNLNALASDTFWNMTSLEEIDLSNNKIQSLNPDLFIYNEALGHLVLSYNPLTTVENVLLQGVTDLDLSFCQMSQISADSFNGVLGASKLNLSNNVIADISSDAFTKMSRLAYLDLSNNSLHEPLNDEIFVKNNMLETLSLRDNPKMKLLPAGGFKGSFSEFFKLNIANCGIEILSPGTFRNLPNLSQLDLSRNSIAILKNDDILPSEIMHLNLAFNNITELQEIQFPQNSRLKKLSLAGNRFKHLQSQFFVNLQHLTSLDLSDCGMEHVWQNPQNQQNTIPALAKVNTINLSGNNLQIITKQDLEVFSNLKLLNIMSNPLSCDEDFKVLMNYLREKRVEPFGIPAVSTEGKVETTTWQDFSFTLKCFLKNERLEDSASHTFRSINDEESSEYYYDEGDANYNSAERPDDQDGDSIKENIDCDHQTPAQNDGMQQPNLNVFGLSVQLVAMLLAAVITFVVIVALLVSVIFCRSRMILHRESMARRRGHQLNVYKPLFDNEHFNTPTTPIMKTREI